MTAEIATLNRTAVTLAADSAVTLTVRGRRKIYQSADKIFDLSLLNPVALMTYNSLEYHQIPLEILIKQFRDSGFCCNYDTLFECADAFLHFLTTNVSVPDAILSDHVYRLASDEYAALYHAFQWSVAQHFTNEKLKRKPDLRTLFLEVLRTRIDDLSAYPPAACFADKDPIFILEAHQRELERALEEQVGERPANDPEIKSYLLDLGALVLHRDIFSDRMTGLVFASFGRSEIFPSLQSVEIDGLIAGRLKQRLVHKIDIDRHDEENGEIERKRVKIIPFAQTDMAQRFLEGIEPRFENEIVRSIEVGYHQILNRSRKSPFGLSKRTAARAVAILERYFSEALEHFREDTLAALKAEFRREIEDMALMMPKQELAFLAEAIINLTSVKRKVSGEEETVAGPIDVAIISRSEGLVWVRRKHYFDPELNPRYFERIKSAITRQHGGSGHAKADGGVGEAPQASAGANGSQ